MTFIRRSPIAVRGDAEIAVRRTSGRPRATARTLLRGLATSALGFFFFFLFANFLDAALGCFAVCFADDVHVDSVVGLAVFEDVAEDIA